ncbi:MAG TPA: YggS family pyridoxal phosphate-dependent enzyme [Gemmatimonadaceae bacterium]
MPFEDLPGRVSAVRDRIAAARSRGGHGQEVRLVAVTKNFGADAVRAVAAAGVEDVGENKVQEALGKMDEAGVPVRWHLIGHLQRNKVKWLERFALLHSVDSVRLAEAIDGWARSRERVVEGLVQVNVAGEETKGGFTREELPAVAERLRGLGGLRVRGVMTMAPYTEDESVLRRTFGGARDAREVLRAAGHPATELSMGMSNDFEIAVEEGSTCVRLGTILLGARPA